MECIQLTLFPARHSWMGPNLQKGLDGMYMPKHYLLLSGNMGQGVRQSGNGRLSSLWDLPVPGPGLDGRLVWMSRYTHTNFSLGSTRTSPPVGIVSIFERELGPISGANSRLLCKGTVV